ncbi:hypothetical protein U724_18410 [Pseudomonas chlororaphis subsp. aurantiaca PB-St2]|nr:hypothetical protein U724_18410 [Pseudomonas chlororaphis subsp. aurantiaca PB-St2]
MVDAHESRIDFLLGNSVFDEIEYRQEEVPWEGGIERLMMCDSGLPARFPCRSQSRSQ